MAIELIAAIVAAAVMGLLAWALRRWVPSLPKWLVPFSAGLGLIGFTVWSEYDWFDRVSAELPASFEVVEVKEEAMPLRPWTFVFPIKMRFQAIDHAKTASHPQQASLHIVTVYSFARWTAPEERLIAVDCAGNRQVTLTEAVVFAEDATMTGGEWMPVAADDKLQGAACKEG